MLISIMKNGHKELCFALMKMVIFGGSCCWKNGFNLEKEKCTKESSFSTIWCLARSLARGVAQPLRVPLRAVLWRAGAVLFSQKLL